MRFFPVLMIVAFLAGCKGGPNVPPPDPNGGTDPASCADFDPAKKAELMAVISPVLINGVPADPKDWPASVYARSGNSACSSTLVGSQTLISAAHCMPNGGSVSFSVGGNAYSAKCTHHPEYARNATADWALCKVSRPVTGIEFEQVGIDVELKVGEEVRLTGYGCTNPGGGGGNDGIFRIGLATVRSLPSGTNYDVYTSGGAALCFGDSGGAAFKEFSARLRKIFGENSRGDIAKESFLTAVFTNAFKTWSQSWSVANGEKICGIHAEATSCRGAVPLPPEADVKFVVQGQNACVEGRVARHRAADKAVVREKVREAVTGF